MLVPKDFNVSEQAFINEIVSYTQNLPGDPAVRTYLDFFALYAIGTTGLTTESVAYNGMNSKAIIHYKQDMVFSNISDHRESINLFERTLVEKHGLPCSAFYNYFDEDIGCASTESEILDALYSDPDRVRQIVQKQDPDGVFYRPLL